MAGRDADTPTRSIRADERSGVLNPANLERYAARWFEPAEAVADVVERYWSVRWNLGPGEAIPQRIIAAPAVTLSIEEGNVPAPFVVTGVYRRAWMRTIAGSGAAFGIRLRPAGLAVLSDLPPEAIADATRPLTAGVDARSHELLERISTSRRPEALASAANAVIREFLADRPLTPHQRLANDVVEELGRRMRDFTGPTLAEHFGVSERSIQRALKATLGQGPKWVARWIRLQEVALRLSAHDEASVATVAAELGYADQAHLVTDFRRAVGITPGAYVRSLRALDG